MAIKHTVTVSTRPAARQMSGADRRAAQAVALSTQQAELKQQAADRRAKIAASSPAATSPAAPPA